MNTVGDAAAAERNPRRAVAEVECDDGALAARLPLEGEDVLRGAQRRVAAALERRRTPPEREQRAVELEQRARVRTLRGHVAHVGVGAERQPGLARREAGARPRLPGKRRPR